MADLEYTLSLANKSFLAGMKEAQGSMSAADKQGAGLSSGLGGHLGKLTALAGGFGVAMLGVKKALGGAASLEQTTIAFQTLTGSVEKGNAALASLRELGANTPLEFPELADAGKKLIAFGESTETLVPTLTRIGDIAAGVGAPIGEMAELYGKARVQGTLFAEDLNQLMARGVPIMQELAKVTGHPVDKIKELASQGAITFPLLEEAFKNLTAESSMFGGMLEAQSKTTAGLWSTLKDGINDVFISLGQPVNDALGPLLRGAIGSVQAFGERVSATIATMRALGQDGNLFAAVGLGLKIGFLGAIDSLKRGLNGVAFGLMASLETLPALVREGFALLFSGDFYTGIAAGFKSAFSEVGAAFLRMLAPTLDTMAEMIGAEGGAMDAADRAENNAFANRALAESALRKALEPLAKAASETGDAFASGFAKGAAAVQESDALTASKAELEAIMATAKARVDEAAAAKAKLDADKDAAKAAKGAATETDGLSAAVAKAAEETKKATKAGKDGDKPRARAGSDPLASLVNRFTRQREDTRGTFKDFVFGSNANQHRLTPGQLRNIGSGAITPETFADYYGTNQAQLERARRGVNNPNAVPASQRDRAAAAESSRASGGNASTLTKIAAHVASLDDRIQALTAA